jgi:hypothetical protein
MTNAVKRQDVQPLQFGGEAWLRRLQLRRSKIKNENNSYVDCHRNSNDFDLAELLTTRAAAMTYADLHTLAVQAGDVLGAWGATQPLTRELTAVLTSSDGKTLLDRAIYVEVATKHAANDNQKQRFVA